MISRRDALALGGAALATATLPRPPAAAQTPRRGGTLTIRAWDPPHFDPVLTLSYTTHVLTSFTHNRLVRHRAGPAVKPGSFSIEGDLAESWPQPSDTTYVFRLRRGVRFHPKPPVNGRELTAEDVRFSVERLLTTPGAPNAVMLRPVDKVEAVDRYTVKFTLKEPFAWFLDMLANPMTVAIVPPSGETGERLRLALLGLGDEPRPIQDDLGALVDGDVDHLAVEAHGRGAAP